MSNLKELIQEYTIKRERTIKKICAPLNDHLGIPHFCYFRIEQDGRFGTFSNYPEQLDFYYTNHLYLNNPYLVHPTLTRSGCVLTTAGFNSFETDILFKLFQMYRLLLILRNYLDYVEGFMFFYKQTDFNSIADFYSNLDMIREFIFYFKKEAQLLINHMMDNDFNIKEEKKEAFFKVEPSLPLSNGNPKVLKFLKTVSPLSNRERQCVELLKQGKSAQATGAILGLSQRTVEHYFDNIKNKLGCHSKWDLLEY